MRKLVFGLVFALACAAFADTGSLADRMAKQNTLFEEFYQSSHPAASARARGRELRAQKFRDAGEPTTRRSHPARRFAERGTIRFRAALSGLHLPITSNPARARTNDRSNEAGRKRRADAAK